MNLSEEFEKHKKLVFLAIYKMFKSHANAEKIANINHMEFDDLVQIGNIALLSCIKNNDKDTAKFSHYAVTSITKKIFFHLKYRGSLIHVAWNSSNEKKKFYSTDKPLSDDTEETYGDFLPSKINVEELVINKITLEEKLNTLNDREKQIMIYKLQGLEDKEIAEILETTNTAIHQVVYKALRKINPDAQLLKRSMNEFGELYEKGCSKEEIMNKLQITADRYRNYKWRYKKLKIG